MRDLFVALLRDVSSVLLNVQLNDFFSFFLFPDRCINYGITLIQLRNLKNSIRFFLINIVKDFPGFAIVDTTNTTRVLFI